MLTQLSDRMVEALARSNRHEQAVSSQQRSPLSIALSRQAGSRGGEVARQVGASLGWPVYDQELLAQIAQEHGLRDQLLERLDERQLGWLEEMIASFDSNYASGEYQYLHSLRELFARLGSAGHCVIVGRGAPHVMPPETTLRVRVIAPPDVCITQVERSQGLTRSEARSWIDRTNRERARFIYYSFGKDPEDPVNYDLVLNTARLSVATCAELIVHLVEEREPPEHVRNVLE